MYICMECTFPRDATTKTTTTEGANGQVGGGVGTCKVGVIILWPSLGWS